MGHKPVMVAVGGDSGSGKTTVARGLYTIFGEGNILNICLDDYHSMDRAAREEAGVTALNPIANNCDLMIEQLRDLRQGRTIVKPVYDHADGTFRPPVEVTPRPIIIVRGLFPLYTPDLREVFDV
ncbi:MAG: zeta toxin family protein, partial [Chloroflexota bacterium]